MTDIRAGTVDVYLVRPLPDGWRVFVARRAEGVRCTGAWEAVHGTVEPDERPENAAIREVREETGLEVERLYNVSVQPFYLHKSATMHLAVVFCAFAAEPAEVVLGGEHDQFEWLSIAEACSRFAWPRSRQALLEAFELLGTGSAGPVEDVLRVR
ncbi:MAG TPA: NUDIX domain-containing protein [Gemmatimonadales bacterium]|nr:NUDIX domain-containing protein [Gemmatimonadales bacterium]